MNRQLLTLIFPLLLMTGDAVGAAASAAAPRKSDAQILDNALACWGKLNQYEDQIHTNALALVRNRTQYWLKQQSVFLYFPNELLALIMDYAVRAGPIPLPQTLIEKSVPEVLVKNIRTQFETCNDIIRDHLRPKWRERLDDVRGKEQRARLGAVQKGFNKATGDSYQCETCWEVLPPEYCDWMNTANIHMPGCAALVEHGAQYVDFPDNPIELKKHLARFMYMYSRTIEKGQPGYDQAGAISLVREAIGVLVDLVPFIVEERAKLPKDQK